MGRLPAAQILPGVHQFPDAFLHLVPVEFDGIVAFPPGEVIGTGQTDSPGIVPFVIAQMPLPADAIAVL